MKNMKLFISVLFVAILLPCGQLFGQSNKSRGDVMPPVKVKNFKEVADQLSKEGWKTDSYSIEEQLASTAMLKCEVNSKTNDALYLWVQQEATGSNVKDVIEKNYINGVTNLTYHVELPYLSQCKLILMQKRGTTDQLKTIEKIVLQVSPMVVQNLTRKSMEIYREQEKTCTVRSIYMLDKIKVYNILCEECIRDASAIKDNAIFIEVFKEALNRMDKKSLW